MVNRHHDHVSPAGEIGAVGNGGRSRTVGESAAMAPEHHRPLSAVIHGWRPDIQYQAVLTLRRQPRPCDRHIGGDDLFSWLALRSAVSKLECVLHAGPTDRAGWRHEAILSRCARTVRDAFEHAIPLAFTPRILPKVVSATMNVSAAHASLSRKDDVATNADVSRRNSRRDRFISMDVSRIIRTIDVRNRVEWTAVIAQGQDTGSTSAFTLFLLEK